MPPQMDPFSRLFEPMVASLVEQDYCVADDFLDRGECKRLLERLLEMHAQGQFKKAGIGRGGDFQRNAGIRGDEILWVEKSEESTALAEFLNKMEAMIAYFNRHCFTGIRDYEAHFALYPPGTYYHRHLDQFKGNDHRKFSFILYLNADWEPEHGGELRLYLPKEEGEVSVDIAPVAGRVVCFRSSTVPHEVLTTYVPRYSVTGWWLDRKKDLSFLD
jgi:SM-20-related protein